MSKNSSSIQHKPGNDQHGKGGRIRKGERTALALLDAAEQLFADKGYSDCSLREVAAVVGIREPGIYRHFSSKAELYQKVLARGLEPLANALQDKFSEQLDGRELAALPGEIFQLLAGRPNMARLLQQAVQQPVDEQPQAMKQWLEALVDQGHRLLLHAGYNLDRQQAGLLIVNLFNLCTAWFTSQHLLDQTTRAPLPDKILEQQKTFLNQAAAAWLGKPVNKLP